MATAIKMRTAPKRGTAPAKPMRHHIDRRAAALAATDGPDDDLLSTRAVAAWLDVSDQFLEIGRHRGYGPKFTRLSPRCVRYRRGDVRAWLRERTHASTAAYAEAR